MVSKLFDKQYLQKEFEKLNEVLDEHITLYLIGGGSMSFQKYKAATKDIDVVVRSNHELGLIVTALQSLNYFIPVVRGPYKQMEANSILENTDGFRWDIFVNVICGGLRLSDGMIERSIQLLKMEHVSVYMICPEDIFVFKSITTRERDQEDMYSLFSKVLDFDIIEKEFFWQNEHKQNDYAWMAFFFDGVEDFFDKYHITHPIVARLHDIAEEDMLIGFIKERLSMSPRQISEISDGLDQNDVEVILDKLIKQGVVLKDKQGIFSLKPDEGHDQNTRYR
ncbi:DUF6036 family nucleotidyltransferase [Methanohalophilus halophilus]|uniref:DUF6036 domain-containing protein n=1 Tax=Methanohalophilus halophilus TaxID=2177 RepID=A0A1L3Q179_9EURY|nr:DUF6036 family nucleotidyltransferase [Methanohalophilus halophilus]APH38551.1 hypothetical protein BHR79_02960 [Methanohalophilus halophilus]RNI08455.1 hypothetical protein EFE40_07920 [Methanohalophilus halophilus]SDW14024.1 hypothetical protein SAMN04515625_0421 [Methanohalophilus halophilus]